MSTQRRDGESAKLRWPDEIDEIFGRANPNPTRQGCPSRDELIALSRKERAMSDPGYVHLTRCSPCYLDVRVLQEARVIQRRQSWLKLAAAAVVVIAVALGAWFVMNRSAPVGEVQAQLDLRPYALMRSETPGDRAPLALPRGRLTLTMILPVGFEPGAYEVQLLDSELASRATAAGTATTENFVTTLQTTMDLSSVSRGTYQLAVRRTSEDWELFPAEVR
jgi:hypothetical protein